ncbi:Serine palmitoyltransferase 1, partial [Fragariocoptes setiger]
MDSTDELETILASWTPDPLVPDKNSDKEVDRPQIVSSKSVKNIVINGKSCLNFACHDYLGFANSKKVEIEAIRALRKYGVGSCGPRGFYGTIDVHLMLEKELAEFMCTQEAILYSFGFTTIASAIPAYAKTDDVVFVDEQCNFAIQQGLVASRSIVKKFRHNDAQHLAQLMAEQNECERQNSKKAKLVRRFLIVEGIYAKTGCLSPLPEYIELKKRYKVRLFIDESYSIGILGTNGRGISEHYNVDINDIDMVMASLETTFCSFGGFCAGSSYIVNHQRLAGLGYCFSASLPPFQAQVARETLKMIKDGEELRSSAWSKFKYVHDALGKLKKLKCVSSSISPIKHLVNTHGDDVRTLNSLCRLAFERFGLAITIAQTIPDQEITPIRPSIRLVISDSMDYEELDRLVEHLAYCESHLPLNN